jgi:hypothetical protein
MEIRQVVAGAVRPRHVVVSLAVPTRSKQTAILTGAPSDVAAELVRRLSDEARAL